MKAEKRSIKAEKKLSKAEKNTKQSHTELWETGDLFQLAAV